jgi:hypothetical protein
LKLTCKSFWLLIWVEIDETFKASLLFKLLLVNVYILLFLRLINWFVERDCWVLLAENLLVRVIIFYLEHRTFIWWWAIILILKAQLTFCSWHPIYLFFTFFYLDLSFLLEFKNASIIETRS